jgi:hypothetical protein
MTDLPWRGPGEGRPDLPLPPEKLPLRRGGVWRKRWRYLGAFSDELLLCAARVRVGPLGQTFWAVWDRDGRRLYERTTLLLPGARGEVWTEHLEGDEVAPELGNVGVLHYAPDEGSQVRVESRHPEGGEVRAFLRTGGGRWAESICPTEDGQYVWTRKREVPVECDVRVGDRRWRVQARGMEDESAGYHPRHTVWSWAAGVGRATDGRAIAWNLVSGINDPPQRSERAIWVDGEPFEPGPSRFEDLEAISFDDGSRLDFGAECERRKDENRLLVRYSYRQPFGTFAGTLPNGIELESGLGVMEHHDARW